MSNLSPPNFTTARKPIIKICGLIFALSFLNACVSNSNNRIILGDLYDDTMDAYEKKEYLTAEQGLNMLSNRVPQDTLVWFRLGNIYARTDRPALAINAYEEALLREPSHPKPWHNKGMIELYTAMFTFSDMLLHIEKDNVFYTRADYIRNAIAKLIEADFETAPSPMTKCWERQSDPSNPSPEPDHLVLNPEDDAAEKVACKDLNVSYLPIPPAVPAMKEMIESKAPETSEPDMPSITDTTSVSDMAKKEMDEMDVKPATEDFPADAALEMPDSLDSTPPMESEDTEKPALATTNMQILSDAETNQAAQKMAKLEKPAVESETTAVASAEIAPVELVSHEIKFNFMSSELTEDGALLLKAHEEQLLSAQRIEIQGVTGNNGPSEYNQTLAAERVASIRAQLIAQGIDENRIDTVEWNPDQPGYKAILTLHP